MFACVHFDLRHLETLPARLKAFAPKLRGLSVVGAPLEAELVVAIVGTRRPVDLDGTVAGTRWMAAELARRGAVIASGGAFGIDAAAHEGALAVGGKTWAVLPTAAPDVTPSQHAALFRRIVERGGSLVHTFVTTPHCRDQRAFLYRNSVLVALADVVIAVHAHDKSGTNNTCEHARAAGKPLWVVPPTPWMAGLESRTHVGGALRQLELGARALFSLRSLFESLGLPVPPDPDGPHGPPFGEPGLSLAAGETRALEPVTRGSRQPVGSRQAPLGPPRLPGVDVLPPRTDRTELAIVDLLKAGPRHPDELVAALGLSSQAVSRALLTLTLDTVVVDGPDGRYRICR